MSVSKEILTFSKNRHAWQQDLMRRLVSHPDLSTDDLCQIADMMRFDKGLTKDGIAPVPLKETHLNVRAPSSQDSTVLLSLEDVSNVNRLAKNQILPFAIKGITINFGFNGSGKTGYSRIAKQGCRARRERHEPILGNIYEIAPHKPAEATFKYRIGNGATKSFKWVDGGDTLDEFARVTVFDATTAPLYADKQGEIEFLPGGMDILPRLGRALEFLAQTFDAEIAQLTKHCADPLPVVPEGTSCASLVARLHSEVPWSNVPSEEQIKSNGSWSDKDASALNQIEEQLRQMSEPGKQAAQLRRLKVALQGVIGRLEKAVNALNDAKLAELHSQVHKADEAKAIAETALHARRNNGPLHTSIGSTAWKQLYRFAQEVSQESFGLNNFPLIGQPCVWCQQPLTSEAVTRVEHYRELMEDSSQQIAITETLRLDQLAAEMLKVEIPTMEDIRAQLAELLATLSDFSELSERITELLNDLNARRTAAESIIAKSKPAMNVLAQNFSIIEQLKEYSSCLEDRAKKFDSVTQESPEMRAAKWQHSEIIAKQKFCGDLAIFLTRREQLERLKKLKECRSECDTRQISLKNSELRQKYITKDFSDRITREIQALKLDYLPLKVDQRTERGTSFIGVALEQKTGAKTSSVLSEGEFRALALACLFAEIRGIPGRDPIVIDDPVSSLDHMHMQQIAQRIVSEASHRDQIVVFTHDLSFYYELMHAAADANVEVHRNWICRTKEHGFGTVKSGDSPWQAKKVKERLTILDAKLTAMTVNGSKDPEDRLSQVEDFYSDLRETWERLVEERLLNGVVGRFQPGVKTQSLSGVEVTDDDYKKIYVGMRRASEYSGHDRAVGRQVTMPSTDQMKSDLKELRDYEKDLGKRADNLSKQRRDLESAPKAAILVDTKPTIQPASKPS